MKRTVRVIERCVGISVKVLGLLVLDLLDIGNDPIDDVFLKVGVFTTL
jgi:hypothetical protein